MKYKMFEQLPSAAVDTLKKAKAVDDKTYCNPEFMNLYSDFRSQIKRKQITTDAFEHYIEKDLSDYYREKASSIRDYKKMMMGAYHYG
tara:strand:- start:92 stop:355 length:264 start_codon:yes stop_codon:yes gene_type:complete